MIWNRISKLLALDNPVQFLLHRILFRGTRLTPCRYRGLEFILDYGGSDASGVLTCLLDPMYRQFLTALSLGPRPTVLDLGANAGGFILMLLAEGYTPAKAVAVEMNPTTFSRLQLNLLMNLSSQCHFGCQCGSHGSGATVPYPSHPGWDFEEHL